MPRYERFVNNSQTTLNGGINDTVTSVIVTDASGSGYPLLGDFRILVDSEVMHVTSRAGNTLTVTRGVDGTSAASHSDGATVNVIITQSGLAAYFDHILPGASARNPARLYDINGNVITSADFTIDNVDGSYLEDNPDGSLTLVSENTATSGNEIHVAHKPAPASTPWTLTVGLTWGLGWDWDGSGSSTTGGIGFRENSTGEFIPVTAATSAPLGGQNFDVFRWNSPTSFNIRVAGTNLIDCNQTYGWFQIEDDGTDLWWRISNDGINFVQMATQGRTAFMAGGPDDVCITLSERAKGSSNNPQHEITIHSWIEE